MDTTEVLISGASIAGPAIAYWLRRQGHSVTVVERAPALRPGGQAVDLRGAGRTVIERMGLMPQARAVTLEQRGLAHVDGRGRITATMAADAFGGEGIISEIEILRGDLGRLLHDAVADVSGGDVEYLFDDTITGITQDEHGVDVTFENAAPRRFGLVIGADGLHSAVRRLAFGPEADCVRPLDCYMAYFTAPAADDLDGWYQMYNMPGGRVASLRPGRLPGETKASMAFRTGSEPIARTGAAAQQDLFTERFAGGGWKVPWLLDAMRAAPDFAFDSVGQVHLDRWSKGRVVLLGDAAYCPTPLTGLGTSLALVGAYVLAGELAAADHRTAFDRYEQVLRPYVTTGQQLPPGGISGYAPKSAAAIRLGALTMRSMTRWPMRDVLAKQFAKAGGIDLPDYCFAG